MEYSKELKRNETMKYALVTGGSRGIGRAVCVKLAMMGYHIIINYANNVTEAENTPVSYTHLDVYKRQGLYR